MPDDLELVALDAISVALQPLDRASCTRVLAWAEARYTRLHIVEGDLDAFSRFTDGLTKAAAEIGGITPAQIIAFAEKVQADA